MNDLLFIFVLIVIYLIAAIPTGIVLSRLMGGEDVRQKGSGNIGATNVYRVAGKLAGILTLLGDTLKSFLPLLACKSWLEPTPTQLGVASAVAIIAHCYPVDLRPRPECAPAWRKTSFSVTCAILKLPGCRAVCAGISHERETLVTYRDGSGLAILLAQDDPTAAPSPRNNLWLSRNPWFERDLLLCFDDEWLKHLKHDAGYQVIPTDVCRHLESGR